MKVPIVRRTFDYRRDLLPNAHLASLEEGVADLDAARERTGLTIGYPGWSLLYYTTLCNLDPGKRNILVETGSNRGCSTIILAQAVADSGYDGRVFSVEIDPDNHRMACENVAQAGLGERVSLFCGDSCAWLKDFVGQVGDIQVAFLDGSHLQEVVLAEFELIHPKLSNTSLVVFDNTYGIADPGEDQRVNGALRLIKHRYGGNLLNLGNVSWHTPGMAFWQRHGFAADWADPRSSGWAGHERVHPAQTVQLPVKLDTAHEAVARAFDVERQPFRRHLNREELDRLHRVVGRGLGIELTREAVEQIMHYCAFVERKMNGRAAGQIEDLIIRYLTRFTASARTTDEKCCHMEIGALFGATTIYSCHATQIAGKKLPTWVIDPMEGYYGQGLDLHTKLPVDEETFWDNVNRFGFGDAQVTLVKGLSTDHEVIERCRPLRLASLLIDGDHSPAGVKADWLNYSPLVEPGGLVILDDYNSPAWPGVTDFVHQELIPSIAGRWEVVVAYSYSLVLRRVSAGEDAGVQIAAVLARDLDRHKAEIRELRAQMVEGDQKIAAQIAERDRKIAVLGASLAETRLSYEASRSWRVTSPLRRVARAVRKIRGTDG